jgi:hypothetical protein
LDCVDFPDVGFLLVQHLHISDQICLRFASESILMSSV